GAPDAGDHRRHPHGVRQDAMKEEPTVVDPTMDALSWLRKQLDEDCPDLVRALLERFAGELMSAEADALCGAAYGERSPERVNKQNGYRHRRWHTRCVAQHAAWSSKSRVSRAPWRAQGTRATTTP